MLTRVPRIAASEITAPEVYFNRRTLLAGALLLFTKPQLFLILAPAVLGVLVARRAWRDIAIVATGLAAVAIGTTAVYPESIAEFSRGAGARGAAAAARGHQRRDAHRRVGLRAPPGRIVRVV